MLAARQKLNREIRGFLGFSRRQKRLPRQNHRSSTKRPMVSWQGGSAMFPKADPQCNVESVLARVIELGQWLTAAGAAGTAEHQVERHLFTQMLAMGAELLGEFFKSVGPGDLGQAVTLNNGDVVKRLPGPSERR